MTHPTCHNCGERLPQVADAFCPACHESLVTEDAGNPYRPPRAAPPSVAAIDEQSPKSSPRDNHERLIVLATYDNAFDAHLLRNKLLDNGIDARVNNESTSAILGATIAGPTSAFWIELLIKESDAEAAFTIKNQSEDSPQSDESEIPEWNCSCGEVVDAGFAVCWNCESEFGG